MRNYFPKRTSCALLHTLSKLYDVPIGFVHPASFEAVYCFICGGLRVAACCSISDDLSCSWNNNWHFTWSYQNHMWKWGTTEEWRLGYIVKLPKKGDISNCQSWKGIQPLSLPNKVSTRVILERIKHAMDERFSNGRAEFDADGRVHTRLLLSAQSSNNNWNGHHHFIPTLSCLLLGQGYVKERLRSSLKEVLWSVRGSYQTIWGPSLPNVTQHSGLWQSTVTPSIDQALHQFTDLDLITEFDFLPNCERYP